MNEKITKLVINKLIHRKIISCDDNILLVCATFKESILFESLGFKNVLVSNISADTSQPANNNHEYQNVTNMSYENCQFDFVYVNAGLHHTYSPHSGLVEMMRVARKGIIVQEGRDSFIIRLAIFFNLSSSYEVQAVMTNNYDKGGVDDTEIPNYVYRWTEREFIKTINACCPFGRNSYYFYYHLLLPFQQVKKERNKLKLLVLHLAYIPVYIFTLLFRKQRNLFTMVALKAKQPDDVWPWLRVENSEIKFNKDYKI